MDKQNTKNTEGNITSISKSKINIDDLIGDCLNVLFDKANEYEVNPYLLLATLSSFSLGSFFGVCTTEKDAHKTHELMEYELNRIYKERIEKIKTNNNKDN